MNVTLSKSISLEQFNARIDQMRTATEAMTQGAAQPGYEPPTPIDVDISGGVRIPVTGLKGFAKDVVPTAADLAEVEANRQRMIATGNRLMSDYRAAVAAYQAAYESVKRD